MCQAKPGLRCAHHAKERIEQYQNKIQEKRDALRSGLPEPESRMVRRSLEGYNQKLAYAYHEYMMTPEGEAETRATLQRMTSVEGKKSLAEKLQQALLVKRRRQHAMNQIKAVEADERGFRAECPRVHRLDNAAAAKDHLQQVKRDAVSLRKQLEEYVETSGNRYAIQKLAYQLAEKTMDAEEVKKIAERMEQDEKDNVMPIKKITGTRTTSPNGVDFTFESEGEGEDEILYDEKVTSIDAQVALSDMTDRNSVPEGVVGYAKYIGFEDPKNWRIDVEYEEDGPVITGVTLNESVSQQLDDFISHWNKSYGRSR